MTSIQVKCSCIRSPEPVFAFSGVQVVPHDRTDTPTPPAVDLSMSPSSRHTPSSPEMTNGNYVPSGVSRTELKQVLCFFLLSFFFFFLNQPPFTKTFVFILCVTMADRIKATLRWSSECPTPPCQQQSLTQPAGVRK